MEYLIFGKYNMLLSENHLMTHNNIQISSEYNLYKKCIIGRLPAHFVILLPCPAHILSVIFASTFATISLPLN